MPAWDFPYRPEAVANRLARRPQAFGREDKTKPGASGWQGAAQQVSRYQ